jgi:branched-chain amino acid transport system substrate-binding protein
MQHAPATMDPVSHHLQQSIYIARWNPRAERPERGIEILGHIPPEQARYEQERSTRLEPLADTPRYIP